MKSLFFVLSMLLLLSCQTKQPATPTEGENNPPQWLQYKGTEGPGKGKHIVLISGDEEYRSEEALPLLASILSEQHGFDCTVLFAQDPARPGIINPNYLHNIPGLEALQTADLMVLFTRFRELPDEQMQHIEDYLLSGRPLIGIRTATHAFNIKDSTSKWLRYSNFYQREGDPWDGGFGRLVLGEKWISHHGHHKHQSTRGLIAPGAEEHPILRGIQDGDIWGPTDVYGLRLPLPGDTQPLVLGQVIDREGEFDENDPLFGMRPTDSKVATTNPANAKGGNPNDPMMPIAWIKSYQLPGGQPGKAFASTIGASTDLLSEGTRRLFVNAVYFLLDLPVPDKAKVELPDSYQPSAYSFHDDAYWQEKGMPVSK